MDDGTRKMTASFERRRHRRFPCGGHESPWMKQLSLPAKGLFFWLTGAPHSTMMHGLVRVSRPGAADMIGCSLEDFDLAFTELERKGVAVADWPNHVVWFPGYFDRVDGPDNGNVVRGYRPHFDEVADSPLKRKWLRELVDHCHRRGHHWQKGFLRAFEDVGVELPEGFGEDPELDAGAAETTPAPVELSTVGARILAHLQSHPPLRPAALPRVAHAAQTLVERGRAALEDALASIDEAAANVEADAVPPRAIPRLIVRFVTSGAKGRRHAGPAAEGSSQLDAGVAMLLDAWAHAFDERPSWGGEERVVAQRVAAAALERFPEGVVRFEQLVRLLQRLQRDGRATLEQLALELERRPAPSSRADVTGEAEEGGVPIPPALQAEMQRLGLLGPRPPVKADRDAPDAPGAVA